MYAKTSLAGRKLQWRVALDAIELGIPSLSVATSTILSRVQRRLGGRVQEGSGGEGVLAVYCGWGPC